MKFGRALLEVVEQGFARKAVQFARVHSGNSGDYGEDRQNQFHRESPDLK
jgi:hypothetical protein